MHIFYSRNIDKGIITLDESESIHLARVLRLKAGDEASVIDGSGTIYRCRVIKPDRRSSNLEVLSAEDNYLSRKYFLHIAIAPTKNIDRFEWFIEKSVEIGIDRITPIICERSERRSTKTERSRKIIISAMKQALRASETFISDALPFEKLVKESKERNRFIAHCNEGYDRAELKDCISPGDEGLILIGPEGDFSEKEVELAKKYGFRELSLGPGRLRTETAGLVACSMYYLINL